MSVIINCYPVEYSWRDANGRLQTYSTVIIGDDAQAALAEFKRLNPHLIEVKLRNHDGREQ